MWPECALQCSGWQLPARESFGGSPGREDPIMSVSNGGGLAVALDWRLEFVRLVAFSTDPLLFLEQNWWQDVASERPDDFVSIRKRNFREDRGSFRGMILTLRVEAGRLEWLLQPNPESGESPGMYPTLGPFREKIGWFVEVLSPWLATSCPSLLRLAFTGKLLQAADSLEDAYRILGACLPAVDLSRSPNDVFFQVNRRRVSAVVPELPINRVSAWSKLNIALSAPSGMPVDWPENCYAALELDMNTAPERSDSLPRESLPPLFRELALLGIEIAEHGDIS
jgi:hypothetical protein